MISEAQHERLAAVLQEIHHRTAAGAAVPAAARWRKGLGKVWQRASRSTPGPPARPRRRRGRRCRAGRCRGAATTERHVDDDDRVRERRGVGPVRRALERRSMFVPPYSTRPVTGPLSRVVAVNG
jgi:hypothetical protein